MGQAKAPKPVKLIVSAFAPGNALLQEAKAVLDAEWGPLDYESDLLPFDHTPYYAPEFGAGLVRRVWAFAPLIDPGMLAAIKLRTNEMEQTTIAPRRKTCPRDRKISTIGSEMIPPPTTQATE